MYLYIYISRGKKRGTVVDCSVAEYSFPFSPLLLVEKPDEDKLNLCTNVLLYFCFRNNNNDDDLIYFIDCIGEIVVGQDVSASDRETKALY